MRVSWGFDAHRLVPSGSVRLGGVVVDGDRGVEATSDGDVLAHAVADAVLGLDSRGDLGEFFPSSDPQWVDADSMELLRAVVAGVTSSIQFVDVTVIAEEVRVSPHRQAIRKNLAAALEIPVERVSVKATSTDGLGFVGRGEGLAAVAVVTGN